MRCHGGTYSPRLTSARTVACLSKAYSYPSRQPISPWSCPLRAIAGTERQEPQSGLNEPADEGTVSPFAEEPRIEEVLHGGTTVLCIKIPQPLDLRPSET